MHVLMIFLRDTKQVMFQKTDSDMTKVILSLTTQNDVVGHSALLTGA